MYYIINRSNRVLSLNILGQLVQILPVSFHKFHDGFRLQEIVHAVKSFKNSLEEFPFIVEAKPDQSIGVYEFDPDKSLERLARELIFTVDEKTEPVVNPEEYHLVDGVDPYEGLSGEETETESENLTEEEKKELFDNAELCNPEDCKDCGETRCLKHESHKIEAGEQSNKEPVNFPELEIENVQDFLSDLTLEDKINSLKSQLKSNLESEVINEEYKLNLVKKIADELCVSYTARSGYPSIYKKILEQI